MIKKYVDIKPEQMKDLIKAVTEMMRYDLASLSKMNHRISILMKVPYNYGKEEEMERIIFSAECLSKYLTGEISKAVYVKNTVEIMLTGPEFYRAYRMKEIFSGKSVEEIESMVPQNTIDMLASKINTAIKIVGREKINIGDVFRSAKLASEVISSAFSLAEERTILKLALEKDLPSGDVNVRRWIESESIPITEINDFLDGARRFPGLRKQKRVELSRIIAIEEYLFDIYGDSEAQKLKREKLLELIEYIKQLQ